MSGAYGVAAVALVALATVLLGVLGLRISRTTSDFYVASRTVPPRLNAAAISGEYLSAASFLGIAGLILAHGSDMLWYPVGYTAGYLVLLVFVAAPLRRSGAYTLPDFAEARLESVPVRRVASVFVIGIGWLYLLPQLQGAGLTLRTATGAPRWLGGVVVAVVVAANVAAGGMRSITFVQAFQYWLKLTALLVPALFLLLAWRGAGAPGPGSAPSPAPHRTAAVRVHHPGPGTPAGPAAAGHRAAATLPAARTAAGRGLADGHGAAAGPARSAQRAAAAPASGDPHPLYGTYGLILATFLGAMGLPHVVVRFYTSPHGRAARRTTLAVLALLGTFYLLPPLYGALARVYAPDLRLSGDTDAAVLVLPERMIGGTTGALLGALLTGGAFAAFLSTSSGLTVSIAGVLTQDVLPTVGVRSFRWATLLALAAPTALTLPSGGLPVADAVGLAFAVAASSFCPLLVLGIWWRRLTPPGAVAGVLAGGGLALAAVTSTLAGWPHGGWPRALLAWPAVWSVPVGFGVMALVSLATPHAVPAGTEATMARLHLPETALGAPSPPGTRAPKGADR